MGRFFIPVSLAASAAGILLLLGGCGSGEQAQGNVHSPQSQAAIQQYRAYLAKEAAAMVTGVKTLARQIEAGELPEAQSTYAAARVPYGHVKPVARLLADLDARIDSLPGEAPAGELSGFHRIEQGFWVAEATAGLAPVARQLLTSVESLRDKLKAIPLRPAELVQSSTEQLGKLSASAMHNKEERYSEIDMVDVSADVEGIKAVFMAARPPIAEADPELAASIETELRHTYGRVRHFGTPVRRDLELDPHVEAPGTGFVLYGVRNQGEYHVMNREIEALAEQLSQAPALLGQG